MVLSNNNAIVSNEVLAKRAELVAQDRECKVISTTIKPLDINSYTCLSANYKISFYVPNGLASIHQKKILILEPSAISYFSKGNTSCLNSSLSLDGIEYSQSDQIMLLLAKQYLPKFISDYLQPKNILNCKHFALGFALDAFKPKNISTIDELKNTKFFQKTSESTPKNLEVIATNTYPITSYYFNIMAMQLVSITEKDIPAIIYLLKTINNVDCSNIQKIEQLLQESLDLESKRIKEPTKDLVTEIRHNSTLRIAISSVKNWTGDIKLSEQDKIKLAGYYQQTYNASYAESNRILDCYSVSAYNFSAILAQICCKLQQVSNTQTISYLWATSNHLMAFKIIKKGEGFEIKFYDPGTYTSIVKVIFVKSINEIIQLKIDDFLDTQAQISCMIKLDSTKSDVLHSSFFIQVNLTDDENEKYFSPEVIEIINTNKKLKPAKSEHDTTYKDIDLTQLD